MVVPCMAVSTAEISSLFLSRCHSRFCPTCGNKYSMDRTTSMSFKLVNVRHRHCVFTIDASLRDFFLQDRSLLNCLFHSVSSVVLRLFSKMNKHKNFLPLVLSWSCIFSAGILNGILISIVSSLKAVTVMMLSGVMSLISTILSFAMLSVLLSSRKCCSASVLLLKVSARCYLEHEHGFYVYAKPNRCDPKTVTKYIGRYLGRPVIYHFQGRFLYR